MSQEKQRQNLYQGIIADNTQCNIDKFRGNLNAKTFSNIGLHYLRAHIETSEMHLILFPKFIFNLWDLH